MKKLLLLLLFVPLVFAGWEATAALAIITAATILAVLYMIGFGFDITELKIMAKEELFQLIALMVMMVVFYGSTNVLNDSLIDAISTNDAMAQSTGSIQDEASAILTEWKDQTNTILNSIVSLDKNASIESSKADQCSLFGMGYSVSACGGFAMLNPPLSMAGGITGFALAEVNGMHRFIEISKEYALTILMPIGILLRTFKITRGAGGFFIALAISMHIMLPLGIIFNEMVAKTFDNTNPPDYTGITMGSISECSPGDPGSNEGAIKDDYMDLRRGIRGQLSTILLRSTLGPVLGLLIMMASIRGLSSLMGAEVDVSSISRFT
ncbi:MAG: hypothetical protein ABID61_00265 [Candidatus Micrarchaeota archaeon]